MKTCFMTIKRTGIHPLRNITGKKFIAMSTHLLDVGSWRRIKYTTHVVVSQTTNQKALTGNVGLLFLYINYNDFFLFNYSRVLKHLQEWKEAPVDSVVLSLFQLQVFYYYEVKRGLAGLGEYTLLPEFSYLHEHCLEHCEEKSPKEIVQAI